MEVLEKHLSDIKWSDDDDEDGDEQGRGARILH